MRIDEALLSRLAIPLRGLGVVLQESLALVVHAAKVVLGFGNTLLGRLLKPLRRLGKVLQDSLAFVIHTAKVVLGFRDVLLGRLLKPLYRLCMVLRNTLAIVVHDTQVVLCVSIPLICQWTKFFQRALVVAAPIRHHAGLEIGRRHHDERPDQGQDENSALHIHLHQYALNGITAVSQSFVSPPNH